MCYIVYLCDNKDDGQVATAQWILRITYFPFAIERSNPFSNTLNCIPCFYTSFHVGVCVLNKQNPIGQHCCTYTKKKRRKYSNHRFMYNMYMVFVIPSILSKALISYCPLDLRVQLFFFCVMHFWMRLCLSIIIQLKANQFEVIESVN